jgi:tRNA uridine 5-carboxymethylaminomethyl modification enzyme
VILTTGTFLRGVIHVGEESHGGGRAGEAPAMGLSASLAKLGFPIARLKTGTPCRLDGRTIDKAGLDLQWGDTPVPRFSWARRETAPPLPQVACWITYTSERTHDIIRANLARSPLYAGRIAGVGPRYCPSIEDKVVRFADKTRHQIFLEPEGIDTEEVYPNGVSTSLPYDVQLAFMRSIPGLERVELLRPGYAVEYDFVAPTELQPWLETRRVRGLFHAGQLNGTSGYEEAAAQGQLAGINAALLTRDGAGFEPFVLGRDEAYAGVLCDDLVTRGTEEPYRILTARAEYRLLLREHSIEDRLLPRARKLGLCEDARWAAFEAAGRARATLREALAAVRVAASPALDDALERRGTTPLREAQTLLELLRRPELDLGAVRELAAVAGAARPALAEADAERLEVEVKYEGYLAREAAEAARQRRLEDVRLDQDFDYAALGALSREAREKLARVRPTSVGQAARIPGVTPAAISILLVHTQARRPRRRSERA